MAGDFGAVPELQKFFQTAQGYVHMNGRADRLTSVLIPTALGVVAAGAAVKGLYGMYTGTSKKD